jgi:hypothetical protein
MRAGATWARGRYGLFYVYAEQDRQPRKGRWRCGSVNLSGRTENMTRKLARLLFALPRTHAAGVAPAPLVDHHQHLLSQPYVALHSSPSSVLPPVSARDVIANLDAAGIRHAVVLSVAYSFGSPVRRKKTNTPSCVPRTTGRRPRWPSILSGCALSGATRESLPDALIRLSLGRPN